MNCESPLRMLVKLRSANHSQNLHCDAERFAAARAQTQSVRSVGATPIVNGMLGPNWSLPLSVFLRPTALCVRTALSMGGSGLGMLLGIRILVVLLPVYAIVRLTSTAVNKPVS